MTSQQPEPIAIVGTGCRFPGESSTASKLWELLRQPRDVASTVPNDRFNLERFYHPDGTHHGTTNVQQSYFLSENVRCFDTQFFGTPPAEAEPMDPQHRMLMETVYEAVESAGLTLEGLQGSDTAVYVGLMCSDYYLLQANDVDFLPTYTATGIANSNASSRLSYFFDWHGPSMTIDTACSSSLVAVHQAVQALRSSTSRVAVAAGTNLLLHTIPYISESKLNMLSPTGRSRMWDAGADGYARGEGVAVVILKTLSSALEDGDHIECIIRETGVNQDGKTKGITMPNAIAQASLIKDTYARARLDLKNKNDRCQYFEAHGTGTPAGDPQEAEALSMAFFADKRHDPGDTLFVGSVKTVIGHTEGAAGIAGLLKASLALKHAIIPPNMHFNSLNPSVEPFYKHLRIVTSAQEWPMLSDGTPRRASVNSFGFGGTNAHAILENYEPPDKLQKQMTPRIAPLLVPFTFSATSEKSLSTLVATYLAYLKANDPIDLRSLAFTLSCRRSALPFKVAFSATTKQQLCDKMEARLQESSKESPGESRLPLGVLSSPGSSSILGIFTGQGAQWVTMGVKLVVSCHYAYQMIEELDQSLAALPEDDRPQWTMVKELLADSKTSRIGSAELSQPLCTAIQIVLVNLLRNAGIQFKAVVGHSSGEIAAAYAAGFISAFDAIRIAYYRGLVTKHASGQGGIKGAMIAVGTSFGDAKEFCELEDFEGRLSVAASNSPTSVTISGDIDAIEEAKNLFEEEKKFARILKVDTAYHSHHMLPCSNPYTRSLQACNIEILRPVDAPAWISSVHQGMRIEATDTLKAHYWVDNMTCPVLFSQALDSAFRHCGSFDMALEIGPHPSLKGPAKDTIQGITGKLISYSGTLSRGKHDVESFSDALGSVWTSLGASAVDFLQFQQTCYHNKEPLSLLKDLPTYPWNHDQVLWSESRVTNLFRTQDGAVHELLGRRAPDGINEEWRWRNVLKSREISWLSGHKLQGQTVFPGTGYIALAMEASMEIAGRLPVKLIELCDLEIRRAIVVNDTTGTEIVVVMAEINSTEQETASIFAKFTCYSVVSKESGNMVINASGSVRISLGEPSANLLAPRALPALEMSAVPIDQFYSAMGEIGYSYDGPFRGMTTLRRKLATSSGTIARPPFYGAGKPLLFHPGMLDTALQGMFAAISAPGDGRLWSLHVPTNIRRITLVPSSCGKNMTEEVAFDCLVNEWGFSKIVGDIDVFSAGGEHKIIEFDGVSFVPVSAATQADDRRLFAESVWSAESPDGELLLGNRRATEEEIKKAYDCERAAFYYLRALNNSIGEKERADIGIPWNHQALFNYIAHSYDLVLNGKHTHGKKEWIDDTHEQICEIMDRYGDSDMDFNLVRAVGENLPSVIRGETTILEHMTKNGGLDDYYTHVIGIEVLNKSTSGMVGQLSRRFPQMNILEVGAGTGGSTRGIISELNTAFSLYTYTDISSGFFEKAQERFKNYSQRMEYKVLNIEEDPTTQGFTEGTYDLVVAALVLHATRDLEQTLRNTRRLLKPGGYLVFTEIVFTCPMRISLHMGGLPGWWVGIESGRLYAPTITLPEWNALLKKTGFSGIDTYTPIHNPVQMPCSVLATQAVDDGIKLLRNPLLSPKDEIPLQNLILLGGNTLETSGIIRDLEDLLKPRCKRIITAKSLDDLGNTLPPMCNILGLIDCDLPIFRDITKKRYETLKNLFLTSRNVLWVTRGCRCEEPYAAMTVGFFRSIKYELPQAHLQLLDIDHSKKANATLMAELLLRLELTREWKDGRPPKDMLWTAEPELMIENEKLLIHRVLPQKAQNDRYNSLKRQIFKDLDPGCSIIKLEWRDTAYILREENSLVPTNLHTRSTIRVDCSLLQSIRTLTGRFFFSLGIDRETGTKVLSVSEKNASTISVPKGWSIPVDVQKGVDIQYFSFIAGYLLSRQILSMMPSSGTLLIHEPDPGLASLLSRQVATTGSRIVYTTSNPDILKRSWLYMHPLSPKRSIDALLPNNVTMFLDLSQDSTTARSLGSRIAASLASLCERGNASVLIAKESLVPPEIQNESVSNMLREAASFATKIFNGVPDGMPLRVMSLRGVLSDTTQTGPLSIVNWYGDSTVPILVEPIEARGDLFEDRKTYWLIGLSGNLGRSLCDWMIAHGARYVVLTSRTPKVAKEWIQLHQAKGVNIAILAGDITNRDDLTRVHDEIRRTLPKIAGVANGALVLRDKALADTDLETFQLTTKPKVEGTIYLNQLFSENTLDFFIPFSSVMAITGNIGQMSYSAANCFMKAVVAQRRRRGLAGSVIDISRVVGVGYVDRKSGGYEGLTEAQAERLLNRSGTLPMSESDLHQLFAEAVLAGRPNSGQNPEIITGLRTHTIEESGKSFWGSDVKFSHFIQELRDAAVRKDSKSASVSVKTRLLSAKNVDDIPKILKNAIMTKLRISLNTSNDETIGETIPLVDLGVDSLVAVEIRNWSLQELKVDLPVLEILGGAAIIDLVDDVMEKLPRELLPKFAPEELPTLPSTENLVEINGAASRAPSSSSESTLEVATPPTDFVSSSPPRRQCGHTHTVADGGLKGERLAEGTKEPLGLAPREAFMFN
ncbi:MAG: Type I Iterative PKS [Geoglossum umbratile]|nr:MAG: Type I Iterative PKS [Geoglossum umbratile]